MRYISRALLPGVLGFVVALVVAACGGSSGLLSAGDATNLDNQLNTVAADINNGQCGPAASAASSFDNSVSNLTGVSPTLTNNLKQASSALASQAASDCQNQQTAPVKTTQTTPKKQTTTTTSTTPTSSTPTSSTPTTPPSTTTGSTATSPATTTTGTGTNPSGGAGLTGTGTSTGAVGTGGAPAQNGNGQ
jgi:hypothetical protein